MTKKGNRYVEIQADLVRVQPSNNKTQPKQKKKKKNKNKTNQVVPPIGINTGEAFSVASHASSGYCVVDPESEGMIETYVDPCGVHRSGLDVKKIKDGAFPISAVAEQRFIGTLTAPNETLENNNSQLFVNMSQLYLMTPLLRAPCILICNMRSKEFGLTLMASFCKAWASLPTRESAYWPAWYPFLNGDEVIVNDLPVYENYFTVLTPTTLKQLDVPSDLGISALLKAYRFVGQGVEIRFNVADLVNQATAVMARFSADTDTISPIREHIRGFDEAYLQAFALIPGDPGFATSVAIATGSGLIPPYLSDFSYSGTVFPSPIQVSDVILRNASGSFLIDIGDQFYYEVIGGGQVILRNVTTTQFITVRIAGQPVSTVRLYYRAPLSNETEPIGEIQNEMTSMVLPPVEQADLQAQNVSTATYLMKDYEGVYLPNQIWNPLFLPQTATSFRKVIFLNSKVKLEDVDDPLLGWYDSYDKNFGFGIINIQGMSQAAAPLVKMIRTDEQVPASNSIIGAYTTRCTAPNPVALDVARCLVDRLPMGFPADYNSMGKLFSLVKQVIINMPVALAHIMNISSEIGGIIDMLEGTELSEKKNPKRRRTAV